MNADEKLDAIFKTVKAIEKRLAAGPATRGGNDVAPDHDLDGQYGDPLVKKDPKRWDASQGSYAGCHYSECPPEYLDVVAEFKDWQAMMDEKKGTEDDKRKAHFNRLDAARARGWAQRLRDGYQAPVRVAEPVDDNSIPF